MNIYDIFEGAKMTPYEFAKEVIEKNIIVYFSKDEYTFAHFIKDELNFILKGSNIGTLKLIERDDDKDVLQSFALLDAKDDLDGYDCSGAGISWCTFATLLNLKYSWEYKPNPKDSSSKEKDILALLDSMRYLYEQLSKLTTKFDNLYYLFLDNILTDEEKADYEELRPSAYSPK